MLAVYTGADIDRALQADAVRLAAAQRRPQDRRSIRVVAQRHRALRRRRRRRGRRRDAVPGPRRAGSRSRWSTSRCRRSSTRRRPPRAAGARSSTTSAPDNSGLPLEGRRRRRRRGVRRADAVVVKDRIIQQRLIPTPMEPRAALAQWTAATGELTLWNTTQNPHIVRFIALARDGRARGQAARHRAGSRRRLRQQDRRSIRATSSPCFCAMKLGRPVKWTETRSENYVADDPRPRPRPGSRAGGDARTARSLGLRGTVWAGHGRLPLDRRARASRPSCTA